MSVLSIVGLQWGDEGKGKIVDFLTQEADVVVRFQGGNNAGHTIIANDIEYKLNLLPSSIISANKISIIGNGVVIDPYHLANEIKNLKELNIDVTKENLFIADNACLIFPLHKIIDKIAEELRDESKIGTTQKGIGPAYADKVSRRAIRVCDITSGDDLANKIDNLIKWHTPLLKSYGYEISEEELIGDIEEIRELLNNYKAPVWKLLDDLKQQNKNIMFEGAQGVMLDIDHGTYPYVTSSNTVSSQAIIGSGFGYGTPKYNIAVVKAYTTRVGEGPMPTELKNDLGTELQTKGHEFGTVTGRQRRCGWIDLVQLSQMIKICGINSIALTKLDVLSGFDTIQACVSYQDKNGNQFDYIPSCLDKESDIKPEYKDFLGWNKDISGIQDFNDLPENAKLFIEFIKDFLQTPIDIVSTGPKREDTIIMCDYFK